MKVKSSLCRLALSALLSMLLSATAIEVFAQTQISEQQLISAHELRYLEREPGVDDYEVTMLVSDRYIRIDEVGENSGFIIYDDNKKKIYSISDQEQSILVIDEHKFTDENLPVNFNVEYLPLADAPTVSGNNVFNYRVYIGEGKDEVTCMEVQLVENFLPEVRMMLENYQKVISGQHVKMTDNKITELQPACYFVDQIYNTGAYYEKGLPIQEWHSNDISKMLVSFKEVSVNKNKFDVPEHYNQFSIDNNSKTFIK